MYFIALIILSMAEFEGGHHPLRYIAGGTLFVAGFGLALWWTGFLGWRNAFGEGKGLRTEGPFAWSRNPIYVVSIVGMAGWAVAVNSGYVTGLLAVWATLYVGAPFLEERWLLSVYGEAFEKYQATVPRFFALRQRGKGCRGT